MQRHTNSQYSSSEDRSWKQRYDALRRRLQSLPTVSESATLAEVIKAYNGLVTATYETQIGKE